VIELVVAPVRAWIHLDRSVERTMWSPKDPQAEPPEVEAGTCGGGRPRNVNEAPASAKGARSGGRRCCWTAPEASHAPCRVPAGPFPGAGQARRDRRPVAAPRGVRPVAWRGMGGQAGAVGPRRGRGAGARAGLKHGRWDAYGAPKLD